MKYLGSLLVFIMCLLLSFNVKAGIDGKIISYVNDIPRSLENDMDSLVTYLTKPYKDDYSKAEAIAYWIASRIVYDQYLYNRGGATSLLEEKQEDGQGGNNDILVSRVGICQDYADLFTRMCDSAGLECGQIKGNTVRNPRKPEEELKNANTKHVWNYFMYKNKKILVDPTFLAGGKLPYNIRISEKRHKKAIDKWIEDNKKRTQKQPINDFYFDFDYKKERGIWHIEEENQQ